ncbi:hypothetical protein B7494_g7427 [Chlorociboria aeruginascens]|nr:hypothetical protein B7494_g7427 [Chlorociboria aeruginascens]
MFAWYSRAVSQLFIIRNLPNLLPQATPELHRQLTFTTSSTKKRKLSTQHLQGPDSDSSPDTPLNSVEDRDSQSPTDLPRFHLPPDNDDDDAGDAHLPPSLPHHLQTTSSLSTRDYISSAASSPSGAYAGLSIEGGEQPGSEPQRSSLAPHDQDTRSQSPIHIFSHRAIMGGAADIPNRASSPLKRRASDLDGDVPSDQQDDVDMIVPLSDHSESTEAPPLSARARSALSVGMLREQPNGDPFGVDQTHQSKETTIPDIDTQISTVETLVQASLERQVTEGARVFLVSKKWLHRVQSRGTTARQNSKEEPEGEIGPIDNSDIIKDIFKDCEGKDFVQLRHGIGVEAFEMFPEDAWQLVMEWYGLIPGSLPIERFAHNTNPGRNAIPHMVFEFHPPIITVHRLWSDIHPQLLSQMVKASRPPAPVFVVSRSSSYNEFLKRVKKKADIDLTRKVRVWRVPRALPAAEPVAATASTATPPPSRPSSPAAGLPSDSNTPKNQHSWKGLLLDVATFANLDKGTERELVDFPDTTNDRKYNGHLNLGTAGLGDDQALVLDEHITGDEYVLNSTSRSRSSPHNANKSSITGLTNQSNSQTNSGRNSPAPSGPMTRGRTQRTGKTPGSVGLSNLGNTCYMNSALQCLKGVEELTKYFLAGCSENDLNYENPLGYRGDIANAYLGLLQEIYKQPVPTSVTPRAFKNAIGRHAPSFSGYGQQDSQEFLGFLLDGLQEDLSRVAKKPYIEKPDSTDEMVNNPEAIREMAAKVWDITKKRDDSVIADLFTGMYKSTLHCPVCAKVSITFDPFNNLTLQLPIENSWSHRVCYLPLNDRPVQICVDMDKNGSIMAMKEFVSKKVGVPVERLFAAEEFKSKIYKVYEDYKVASEEIGSNDNPIVYELESKPSNWPPTQKLAKKQKLKISPTYDSDEDTPGLADPAAQKMIVPVLHRRFNTEKNSRPYGRNINSFSCAALPHFIILTPEEARSEDIIRRKILEKVVTLSTYDGFVDDEEETPPSVAESIDPDMVITTGSDADSSGGSKVVAHSIDGEDELVDVTMKEGDGVRDSMELKGSEDDKVTEIEAPKPLKNFNTRRPGFLKQGSYLNPDLQGMFDLCYFQGSKEELVPSGWNIVNDDKIFPTLSSRNPHLQHTMDDDSVDHDMRNDHSGSETSNEDDGLNDLTYSSTTRMNEESSEDELNGTGISRTILPVRTAGPKSVVRVGQIRRRGHTPDEGPLVRLGEGIIVQWHSDAWNAVFEADGPSDTMRGEQTFTSMPILPDPELEAKRLSRAQRRRNGITLDDCLDEFGKEEILSEMDTWYCPRCKEHQRASKKLELWKTPDILIVHLKRFSSSATRRDKLDVHVDFPIEGLDLTPRVVETGDGKAEIYDLFAVDDHWGGLGGGHYTAFAKNFLDGQWYEYNDSSVTKQHDASRIVSASAYLLFYRRRSDQPLGGPKLRKLVLEYKHAHEDDENQSGEGQSLVANSSLHGSSSALTGVGAALHQPNPGSDQTINPSQLESLPAYEEMDEDATPLLVPDSMDDVQESIEDEAIDVGMNYSNVESNSKSPLYGVSNWDFSNIPASRGNNLISGTVSDNGGSDDGSEYANSVIAAHESSGSEGIHDRLAEFENTPLDDDYIDESIEVPDIPEEYQFDEITLLSEKNRHFRTTNSLAPAEFEVTSPEQEENEEPATEIHVEEGEGLKMD